MCQPTFFQQLSSAKTCEGFEFTQLHHHGSFPLTYLSYCPLLETVPGRL